MVENFSYIFELAFAQPKVSGVSAQRKIASSSMGYQSPVVVDPQLYSQITQVNLPQSNPKRIQPQATAPANNNWQAMFKQPSRPKSKKLSGSVNPLHVSTENQSPSKKDYEISSIKKSGCLVCIFYQVTFITIQCIIIQPKKNGYSFVLIFYSLFLIFSQDSYLYSSHKLN